MLTFVVSGSYNITTLFFILPAFHYHLLLPSNPVLLVRKILSSNPFILFILSEIFQILQSCNYGDR